jgi:hypothetical protein
VGIHNDKYDTLGLYPARKTNQKWKVEYNTDGRSDESDNHVTIRLVEDDLMNKIPKYLANIRTTEVQLSLEGYQWRMVCSPQGLMFMPHEMEASTCLSLKRRPNTGQQTNENDILGSLIVEDTSTQEGKSTTDSREGCYWLLQPCLPGQNSGRHLATVWGVRLAGVGTVLAAPAMVMGVVGGIGFGAGGIVGGSAAAGMMSAEAIAAGSGVAAGGTVAILQSIGAAGLGATGTSMAMGGGALFGGALVGAANATVLRQQSPGGNFTIRSNNGEGEVEEDGIVADETAVIINRPFAGWRQW